MYGPHFDKLKTPKQKVFVAEYLNCLNGAEAARRAGYNASSNQAFAVISRDLLRQPKVAAAIKEGMDARTNRLEVTGDRIIRELAKISFADPRKFFTKDGSAIPITDLGDDEASVLAGFRVVTTSKGEGVVEYTSDVRMHDKIRTLELLGKHLGMFKDIIKVEQDIVTPGMLAKMLQNMSEEELTAMFAAAKLLKPLTDAVRGSDDVGDE